MALTQGDPGEGRVQTETPSPAWELESGREQGPQVPLGEWTLLGGHRDPWGLEWVTCSWKTPRAGALPDAASSFLLNPGSTSELDIVPWAGTAARADAIRLRRVWPAKLRAVVMFRRSDAVGVRGRRCGCGGVEAGGRPSWLSGGKVHGGLALPPGQRLTGSTWLSRNAAEFTLFSFAMQSSPYGVWGRERREAG